jgi:structural maintenance of chromosome 3 (chondroitin sulfate proteoglycan 6)
VSIRLQSSRARLIGPSLFHVVVDNDETVSSILAVMSKEKSGRVTFMPLNRLKSQNVQYPKADDALPMISKLKFDRTYIMAFEQVRSLLHVARSS